MKTKTCKKAFILTAILLNLVFVTNVNSKEINGVALSAEGKGKAFTLGRASLSTDRKEDNARVRIFFCRNAEEVKFESRGAAFVANATLEFSDGSEHTVQFYRIFQKGQTSKWFGLPAKKCIDSIKIKGYGLKESVTLKVLARK